MPKAELPTHAKGWAVWLAAGLVGLLAGFLFILIANKVL
jgi:hypothetical protein